MRIEGSLFLLFLCLCACVACCYVSKFKVERSYHMNDFLLCNLVHESFTEGNELFFMCLRTQTRIELTVYILSRSAGFLCDRLNL